MHPSLFPPPSRGGAFVAALAAALVLAGRAAPRARGSSAAPAESFQLVGKLVRARDDAQATLLNDGTVLVTGGENGDANGATPLASAELFDPKTNQFTAVGAMSAHRDGHQAVRLQDGRVLITGGTPDYVKHLRSAEIFDPSTQKFTAVGDMAVDRAAHTATLLHNGQVLITGGWSVGYGPTEQAELFDPATGTFRPTGSMTTGRYLHSAVALPDGRVAILGGAGPHNEGLTSVEVYDPASGTFSAQGGLVEARLRLTATLLPDGRILVVGGQYTSGSKPQIAGTRKSVEIYDPATGQSVVTDTLPAARVLHVAVTLPDGRTLVAGGAASSSGISIISGLKTAVLIDPVTGKATPAPPMSAVRVAAAAVTLPDGRALVIGGWDAGGSSLRTAETYGPSSAATPGP